MSKVKKNRPGVNKLAKSVVGFFGSLAIGLVKVWHKNHAFIISKEAAIDLTIEQLNEWVNEREKDSVIP